MHMLLVNKHFTKVEKIYRLIKFKLETNAAFVLTNDERKTASLASA